jgi:dienelactone hydrolase
MRQLMIIALVALFARAAEGKVVTETVEYKQGDTVCEGVLAYDDASDAPRPGVLVVHEWNGVGKYVVHRCEMLAALGYVAFAADIYGKGVRPQTTDECAKTAAIYRGKDRSLIRARARAALDVLLANKLVDKKRVAAIGYCFGGTAVLELARSGAELAGVVSFHGALDTPNPDDAKNIKCKILACHGGDDPFVTADAVAGFEKEMRDAHVDWQLVKYGGTVHSFTNPDAGGDNSKGAAYNAASDKRSWAAMQAFFGEIFGAGK